MARLQATWTAMLVTDLDHPIAPLGVHPLVTLLGEWTDRLARIAKAAADVGLEVRWQSIRAADGARLGQAYARALADPEAALTDQQREALARAVRRELSLVEVPDIDLSPTTTHETVLIGAGTPPKEGT